MHAHDRAVDHLKLAVVSFHYGVHQTVPDSRLPPAVEPIVNCRVRSVTFGQIAPRRASAQNVKHAVENLPIVLRLGTSAVHRQQRLDNAPLEVGKIVAHDPSSDVCERESLFESRV